MKKMGMTLLALALAGMLAACTKASAGGKLMDPAYPTAPKEEDHEAAYQYRKENMVDDAFLAGLQTFAVRSGAALLGDGEENVNYSPVSLYLALALSAQGAGGENRQELLSALGAADAASLAENCGKLYRTLYKDDAVNRLKLATSLWVDEGKELQPDFAKAAGESFYAQVYGGDLESPIMAEAMAAWVKAHTGGQIAPKAEPQDALARLVLMTCLDYKTEWIDRFDPKDTTTEPFTRADGTVTQARYLHREQNPYSFFRGEGFVRSGLPLKDGMTISFILPEEGTSPAALTADPAKLQEALFGGQEGHARVYLDIPKFDFMTSLDLKETVAALGVEAAFREDADFSALLEGKEALFLSGVTQDTHIALDENGITAAAFTRIDYAGAAMPVEEEVHLTLNRPFLYALTDARGAVLFIGLCGAPAEA